MSKCLRPYPSLLLTHPMTSVDRLNNVPSFYERYYLCRNLLKQYSNFNVTVQYDNRLGHVTLASLSHALSRLMARHPALACNFFRISGTPGTDSKQSGRNFRKRAVPDIYFKDLVHFHTLAVPFDHTNLDLLNQIFFPLDVEAPLWQLHVFYHDLSVYLSFVTDHLLFDGRAALNFHRELLREIRPLDAQGQVLSVVFSDSNKYNRVVPPTSNRIEDLYDVPWWSVASAASKQIVIKKNYPLFQYPGLVGRPQVQFDLLPVLPEAVLRVSAALRLKNLTLTPYICAIADEAIRKCFLPFFSLEPMACAYEVVVDGRRYALSHKDELAFNYCVGLANVRTRPQTPILASISNFASLIKGQIASRETMRNIAKLRNINAYEYIISQTSASTKSEKLTMLISNLGLVDLDCGSIVFSQDLGFPYHWGLLIISSQQGGMAFVVTYAKQLKLVVNTATGLPAADLVGPYIQERFEFLIDDL